MHNKLIIGLIGDDKNDRDKVAKIFSDIGFYRTSIFSKTKELAKYLLPEDILSDENIDKVRKKGYNVSKCYWINLVLASIPDGKELIVIDDLNHEDLIKGIILPYGIHELPNKYVGFETINPNSQTLEADIHVKIKRIAH